MTWTGLGNHRKATDLVVRVLLCMSVLIPATLGGQETPDSLATPDSLVGPPPLQLPVHAILGIGYGMRSDACVLCESPEEDSSFSAYLGIIRPLMDGLGVGLDANVWRKGRPGTPGAPDPEGVPEPISLANMLANISVSFSYDYWHLFVRAGAGVAYGSKDLEMENAGGDVIVHRASGWGPGYSLGAGFAIPLASMASLAFYGNWNVGQYDMVSPQGLFERDAKHQYLELGVGVTVR